MALPILVSHWISYTAPGGSLTPRGGGPLGVSKLPQCDADSDVGVCVTECKEDRDCKATQQCCRTSCGGSRCGASRMYSLEYLL